MARRGPGTRGQGIELLTNHFKVNVIKNIDEDFHQYSVALYYEDGTPVDAKYIGRKVMEKAQVTYHNELGRKQFAYDGENSLFTIGQLPNNKLDFLVVIEESISTKRKDGNGSPDGKRLKAAPRTKTYKVELSHAATISIRDIGKALRGQESENSQEAIRVLDIILRQRAAKQNCLLVRQSYFHNDPTNLVGIGEGILACSGFHSSFRTTQGGLSLNIDVTTTMVVQAGSGLDFLKANHHVREIYHIKWDKAKRTLKNLRVKTYPSNQEYKITGLSEESCKNQIFSWRQRVKDGEYETKEVTVYDYFVNHRKIQLRYSADLPCINVGKPKRPTFIPVELCSLIPFQRYTKALSTTQRASLVDKSRKKPHERMIQLKNGLRNSRYDEEHLLQACGVSINTDFTSVKGRILKAPKLMFGNGQDHAPTRGRWNLNNKTLVDPVKIERWAVVNFCHDPRSPNVNDIINDFITCGKMNGMRIESPYPPFREREEYMSRSPLDRVEKMYQAVQSTLHETPKFILCILPERKNCDIYGPWKKKCLAEAGIVTQCIAPPMKKRNNDMYFSNLLLKVNAKLGGLNSMLAVEHNPQLPHVSDVSTMILGMDVSHGSPGQSDIPSIAAVVGSLYWPLISRYRASVRTQSPKLEMIDSLFKPVSDNQDEGIMKELLLDYYASSGKRKPDQIIIFRDGVSESQFNQVLNIELEKIIEACEYLDQTWHPKFAVIVAQKNHHTKFFQNKNPDNVPAGTIIDNQICHPRNNDFYLCAHAGMIGTTRPTHYHILFDEVGFSPDELQELVHSLSYVYQRSTTAISIVAPISYAHLAAAQLGTWLKFENMSETSSSRGETSSSNVPQLPPLHRNVKRSMFFC